MDQEQLIIDIDKIPLERDSVDKNVGRLLEHARFLEGINDVEDPLTKHLLEAAPLYIYRQLERLQLHLDDEADVIAWISRSLMELFFMLRYMYRSSECYDEVMKEQLTDLKEIEDVIFPDGLPSADVPNKLKAFHSDMKTLWETLEKYGVNRDVLRRPNTVRYYAERTMLLHEYDRAWRIHSKYVHPTSYLIFGKKIFVYGEDARRFFLVMAQYYAAWNLRDLHGMVLKARELLGSK